MNPIEKQISSSTQQPLIPKKTLDPFSTAAIFTLYNVLYEQDRFGISGHTVIHQASSLFCTLPLIGDVNYQTISRNYYRSSREEASDFVIAIIESISAYINYESFRKMLPFLEKGLVRYAKSYGAISDIATTTFKLAIDRTKEAIAWTGKPEEFRTKHRDEFPKELLETSGKFYNYWAEDEIFHVTNGIFLAIQKEAKNKSCKADVEATLKYLEIKQAEITPDLEAKLKTLHGNK